MEQTFEIFLYHTKHVSKHLQAINDISIILNNFLITFQGRGKEGGKTTMENSTNFINILIKPYAKITRRYMFEITQNLFLWHPLYYIIYSHRDNILAYYWVHWQLIPNIIIPRLWSRLYKLYKIVFYIYCYNNSSLVHPGSGEGKSMWIWPGFSYRQPW